MLAAYKTRIAGSTNRVVGTAQSCKKKFTPNGKIRINLRGTGYRVAGIPTSADGNWECKGNMNSENSDPQPRKQRTCGSWITYGWRTRIEVKCTYDGQKCDLKCGGNGGGCCVGGCLPAGQLEGICRPAVAYSCEPYLQLERLAAPPLPPSAPLPPS